MNARRSPLLSTLPRREVGDEPAGRWPVARVKLRMSEHRRAKDPNTQRFYQLTVPVEMAESFAPGTRFDVHRDPDGLRFVEAPR